MRRITLRPNLLRPASVGSKQPSPSPVARIVGQLHDAQPARVEDIDEIELVLDRIGALEMDDDGRCRRPPWRRGSRRPCGRCGSCACASDRSRASSPTTSMVVRKSSIAPTVASRASMPPAATSGSRRPSQRGSSIGAAASRRMVAVGCRGSVSIMISLLQFGMRRSSRIDEAGPSAAASNATSRPGPMAIRRRLLNAADAPPLRAARMEGAAGRLCAPGRVGGPRSSVRSIGEPRLRRAAPPSAGPPCRDASGCRRPRVSAPTSTKRPAYITSTREQKRETSAMLWVIRMMAVPVSSVHLRAAGP